MSDSNDQEIDDNSPDHQQQHESSTKTPKKRQRRRHKGDDYFGLSARVSINKLYQPKKRKEDKNSARGVFKRKLKYQGNNSVTRHPGTDRQYLCEVPYQIMRKGNSRSRSRNRIDDTRSLFDDPKLQRIKLNSQKQVLDAIGGQLSHNQPQWSPIETTQKLPKGYHFKHHFREVTRSQNIQAYGPKNLQHDSIKTELDAFRVYFDDELIDHILHHTQQGYHRKYNLQRPRFKKEVYFYCTNQKGNCPRYENYFTRNDLLGFISIYLYFGVVKMRNVKDYWDLGRRCRANKQGEDANLQEYLDANIRRQTQSSIHAQQSRSIITQDLAWIMPFEAYRHLRTYLRFGPKRGQSEDPIRQIRDLIELANRKFQHYFAPGEWLSLDEGMIPFNGKATFKVFNPQKPTKWGIKEYVLTDAQLPYTLLIRLHDGRDDEIENSEQAEMLRGKTQALVLSMIEDYEMKGHKLVMDNYYNSPNLFLALKARGIGGLGTLRHNRTGLQPSDIKSSHFHRIFNDERVYYVSKDEQLLLMYFLSIANHPVAFLTSFLPHDNTSSDIQIQSLQLRPRREEIPQILTFYNQFKGGVDRRNGFCAYMRRKGENETKWWRSVFWRIVESAVINAFVLYKSIHREDYKQRTFQDFRIQLIIQLSAQYSHHDRDDLVVSEFAWVKSKKWFMKKGHTLMTGFDKGKCVQCKEEDTQDQQPFAFDCSCSDCSMSSAATRTVFVCPRLFCRRFHKFSDFEMNIQAFERIQLALTKVNKKPKRVAQQERRLLDSRFSAAELKKSTMEAEKQKLGLMQKRSEQLANINTLMQRIQGHDVYAQIHERTVHSKPKAEQRKYEVIEDHPDREYRLQLDRMCEKYGRKPPSVKKDEVKLKEFAIEVEEIDSGSSNGYHNKIQ